MQQPERDGMVTRAVERAPPPELPQAQIDLIQHLPKELVPEPHGALAICDLRQDTSVPWIDYSFLYLPSCTLN